MRRWLSAVGAVEPQARQASLRDSYIQELGLNMTQDQTNLTVSVYLDVSCHVPCPCHDYVISIISIPFRPDQVWGQLLQVGDLEAVQEAHLES